MRSEADRAEAWFEIDPEAIATLEAMPAEPDAADPFLVEFDEGLWLDPDRATDEPEQLPAASREPSRPFGLIGSLAVHLSPLLLLLSWSSAPAEIAAPIPVQLVIEQPPPPAPPASAPMPPTERRLASEEMGGAAEPPVKADPTPPHPATPAPPAQQEQQLAAIAPPPPPKPVTPPVPTAPQALPKPPPRKPPAPAPAAQQARPALPRPPVPRSPGPAATRDEYFAYLAALTRRHLHMLPRSFIAGRRGETVLAIQVHGDGTIARIAVARSSGYPDIDTRVGEVVAALRRFPPVPQWIQTPILELNMSLRFPEALER